MLEKILLSALFEGEGLRIVNYSGVNIPIDPKKIAKFCFLVVLCQVWSSLQHTKNWTKLEYGKVSNFEDDFFRFTGHFRIIDLQKYFRFDHRMF